MDQTLSAPELSYAVFEANHRAFPDAMSGLDVLVTPPAPGKSLKGSGRTSDPVFNYIRTLLHVPAGARPNGLPSNIQIVGLAGDHRAILAWAQWVEAAIG